VGKKESLLAMIFTLSSGQQMEVEVFFLDGSYYSRAENENSMEWRVISVDGNRKVTYRMIDSIPQEATRVIDKDVPDNLAELFETVYTYSPFEQE
jgi:hypothetical protein